MESIQNIIDEIKAKDIIELIISVVILGVFFLGSSMFSKVISIGPIT